MVHLSGKKKISSAFFIAAGISLVFSVAFFVTGKIDADSISNYNKNLGEAICNITLCESSTNSSICYYQSTAAKVKQGDICVRIINNMYNCSWNCYRSRIIIQQYQLELQRDYTQYLRNYFNCTQQSKCWYNLNINQLSAYNDWFPIKASMTNGITDGYFAAGLFLTLVFFAFLIFGCIAMC